MKWKAGDTFLCSSAACECEIEIKAPPRPGRVELVIPSCIACGTPMLRKE